MIRLILILSIALNAENNFQIEGTVTSVIDGNTLVVTTSDGQQYPIILSGIDCPEPEQNYGMEAKHFMENLIFNKEVVVDIYGKDRLKNYIGVVLLEDSGDVRFHLLEEGLAWTSEREPVAELEVIRIRAMAGKKGLWSDDKPTPPWIFRRQQSMMEPKSR